MKSWNVLLKVLLMSVVFSLTSVHANEVSNPLLNINNASLEQLEKMKGIGAKKARAIIEYRLKNGNFATIEDLSNVKGIGSKFIDKNKASMSVQ
jgi:competence protein ComEA